MKRFGFFALILILALCPVTSLSREGSFEWFSFNKRFISSNYPSDHAISSLKARLAHQAATIHESSCGGKDAELHIGISINDVDLANNLMPLSSPVVENDEGWGLVAELPNASDGDGPNELDRLEDRPVTFSGYFRVWSEVGSARIINGRAYTKAGDEKVS
jgi:hypothetical protein